MTRVRSLALVAAIAAAGIARSAGAEPRIIDRVVAVIDDDALFASELRERAAPFLLRIEREIAEPVRRAAATAEAHRELLRRMIDEVLFERAAKDAYVSVAPDEVDTALRSIAEQNKLTPEQVLAMAAEQGLPERAYREELRRQLLEGKLLQIRMSRKRISLAGLSQAEQSLRLEAERRAWIEELRRGAFVEVRL